MEIKQLICPGCGASISAKSGTDIIVCEYCHNSFTVDDVKKQRDEIQLQMDKERAQAMKDRYEFDKSQYERITASQKMRPAKIMAVVFVLAVLGIIIAVVLSAAGSAGKDFSKNTAQTSTVSSKSAPVIIKDIDEIPTVTINRINNDSIKAAKKKYTALYGGWKLDNMSIAGNYLISYDNEPSSVIITIIKSNYSNSAAKKTQSVYSAFCTYDLCRNDDGTTLQSNPSRTSGYCKDVNPQLYLDSTIPSLIFGWNDNKELYKDCISYIEKKYHISYAGDVYIPKSAENIASKAAYIPSIGEFEDTDDTEEASSQALKTPKGEM